MPLPDFLAVGPIKCGTTQLYQWLYGHPEIFLNSDIKEISFFNRHYAKGVDWYRTFFFE